MWDQLTTDTVALIREAVETRDAGALRRLADAVECLPPAFDPEKPPAKLRPTTPTDPTLPVSRRTYHAHRDTEAADPYRVALLALFIEHEAAGQEPPTVAQVLDRIGEKFGREFDPAQVRRDIKALGLQCSPGSSKRTGQHWQAMTRATGRTLPSAEAAALVLIRAINPEAGAASYRRKRRAGTL